ncbi:hypothetical protein [Rhodopila globiformis]|jgi:hypothetical protein|uniref:Uncharacterized protein n=1 Tax=Rhodopila globiformis TaxID=1071 RepID=A0A2S6N158_RHOGL|nr:hypothetical protein [Rhodopila globiformis]PPQ28330.1 hypothetical protein CCS01_24825 [Rhodopila globiformis]
MKFGVFHERPLPRPWSAGSEYAHVGQMIPLNQTGKIPHQDIVRLTPEQPQQRMAEAGRQAAERCHGHRA